MSGVLRGMSVVLRMEQVLIEQDINAIEEYVIIISAELCICRMSVLLHR